MITEALEHNVNIRQKTKWILPKYLNCVVACSHHITSYSDSCWHQCKLALPTPVVTDYEGLPLTCRRSGSHSPGYKELWHSGNSSQLTNGICCAPTHCPGGPTHRWWLGSQQGGTAEKGSVFTISVTAPCRLCRFEGQGNEPVGAL